MTGTIAVRRAKRDDSALILALITELAAYERLTHEVEASEERIADALFGAVPKVFCDIVEVSQHAVGFAVWFYNFSTFRGRHGIYLEDLYVRPEARGRGIGKRLLAHLARRCVQEGLVQLEWSVLDWNEAAIGFYRSQGAEWQDEWTVCRLSGTALWRLADEARQWP